MSLESATTINQLDPSNPAGPDKLSSGDDHIRLIKQALKNTFPNITGPMLLTQAELAALVASATPVGVMSLWYGSTATVPLGYAICDGRTVARSDGSGPITTLDMRDRVAAGASSTFPPGTAYGQPAYGVSTGGGGGGAASGNISTVAAQAITATISGTALTVAQMPSHSHGNGVADDTNEASRFAYGQKAVPFSLPKAIQDASGPASVQGLTETIGNGTAHDHTATISSVPAHTHTLSDITIPAHGHAVTVPVVQPSLALHYIMRI